MCSADFAGIELLKCRSHVDKEDDYYLLVASKCVRSSEYSECPGVWHSSSVGLEDYMSEERKRGIFVSKSETTGELNESEERGSRAWREGKCGSWARSAGTVAERTCLGLFGCHCCACCCACLVLLAPSRCRFHPFGEIWIC